MRRVVPSDVSAAVTAWSGTSADRDQEMITILPGLGGTNIWCGGSAANLHQKLFLAVFGLELDLEAAGRDLTRVLPVLQVVLVLFLSIG